jgi:glycosyltransferase involved in cell wall biosynthesis
MASTPRAEAPAKKWIALLGRRDLPTDGIGDYCSFLGVALGRQNVELRNVRVNWAEEGWIRALRRLWVESADWRESWVLLQYTAMSWARRGFPFGVLAALAILRRRGTRCAVVFHEPTHADGQGWVARLRGDCQDWVIRRLYNGASKAIFADPLEKIPWLPDRASKAAFIPVGANIPVPQPEIGTIESRNGDVKTVAVFCLSDPPHVHCEVEDISHAMRFLAERGVKARAVFVGRGTAEAKEEIERTFDSTSGEVVNYGVQSAEEVSRILSESDAMLCVRGALYPRRGSAIAGIACGLPIVAYAGPIEGSPFEEAGLALVPYHNRDALAKALEHVLTDSATRAKLQAMSLSAQRHYFSWDVIASKLVTTLGYNGE